MPLAKTKQRKGRKRSQSRFEREWQRVKNFEKRNIRLEKDIDILVDSVSNKIGDVEADLCTTLHHQTQHLLSFLQRKSLAQWQRIELMEWIDENLSQLSANPFSKDINVHELFAEFQKAIEVFAGHRNITMSDPSDQVDEPEQRETKHDSKASRPESFTEDMFEELFEEFDKDQDDFEPDFFSNSEEEHQEYEETEPALEPLKKLMKTGSIRSIFRRLAKKLHPDLASEDNEKEKMHHEMSALVEARDNNDIFTLFTLYEKHIGESPLKEVADNMEDVINLLKAHAERLEEERFEIIYKDPIKAQIYEKFNTSTKNALHKKISTHIKSIRESIDEEKEITLTTTSIKKLKPYLEARYQQNNIMGELENFVEEFFE